MRQVPRHLISPHCFTTIKSELITIGEKCFFENFVVSDENVASRGSFSYENPFVFSDSRAPLNCIVYEPIDRFHCHAIKK